MRVVILNSRFLNLTEIILCDTELHSNRTLADFLESIYSTPLSWIPSLLWVVWIDSGVVVPDPELILFYNEWLTSSTTYMNIYRWHGWVSHWCGKNPERTNMSKRATVIPYYTQPLSITGTEVKRQEANTFPTMYYANLTPECGGRVVIPSNFPKSKFFQCYFFQRLCYIKCISKLN